MEQAKLDEMRAALQAERESLERQLTDLGVTLDGEGIELSVDEGFADSAQATAERSELLGLVEKAQAAREEVLAAIARLDDGTYGKCENCGREIPFERLQAMPSTRLCVGCKEAASGR